MQNVDLIVTLTAAAKDAKIMIDEKPLDLVEGKAVATLPIGREYYLSWRINGDTGAFYDLEVSAAERKFMKIRRQLTWSQIDVGEYCLVI